VPVYDRENTLVIELPAGRVVIELLPEVAAENVARIKELARSGAYDGVGFHRVIDGFVAQGGDVEYGEVGNGYNPVLVGTGGSGLPDLPLEASAIPFERGVVGMARGAELDSANSQFFIMFEDAAFLNGRYSVVGRVAEGMEAVDALMRMDRDPATGVTVNEAGQAVLPDAMESVDVLGDALGRGLTVEEARDVALVYEAGLDRDGDIDLPGLNFWIDWREGGGTAIGLAAFFLDSDEFQEGVEAFLGDGTDITDANVRDPGVFPDDDFVVFLYENVLDRAYDQEGFDFWSGVLDANLADPDRAETARERMLLFFADSDENREAALFIEDLVEVLPSDWAFV